MLDKRSTENKVRALWKGERDWGIERATSGETSEVIQREHIGVTKIER